MRNFSFSKVQLGIALVVLSSFLASCATQANSKYFGQTAAPEGQVLRYVSGSEPESLDPQVPTGQPEARVLMAFYDGLVEYEPKTMGADSRTCDELGAEQRRHGIRFSSAKKC